MNDLIHGRKKRSSYNIKHINTFSNDRKESWSFVWWGKHNERIAIGCWIVLSSNWQRPLIVINELAIFFPGYAYKSKYKSPK